MTATSSSQFDTATDDSESMNSAIVINNAGVSLLQKGHFQSAKACFRDAVSIVVNLFPEEEPIMQQFRHLSDVEIDEKVTKANQRLAHACQEPVKVMVGISLEMFVDDDQGLLSHCDVFWRCPSVESVFVIRIEPTTVTSSQDPQVDTCAILSNYASAHRTLARQHMLTDEVEYRRTLCVGLSLLSLAYAGVTRRLEERTATSIWTPLLEHISIILHNLVGIQRELALDAEAVTYTAALEVVQMHILSYHVFLNSCQVATAASA